MGSPYAAGPGITTLEIPGAHQSRYRGDRSSHPVQVRTRVLNQQLRNDFERWHPQLRAAADPVCVAA